VDVGAQTPFASHGWDGMSDGSVRQQELALALLAPGMRADLNGTDLNGLTLGRPVMHHDLPVGGSRFLQPVTGYLATFVAGVQTGPTTPASGRAAWASRSGRNARIAFILIDGV